MLYLPNYKILGDMPPVLQSRDGRPVAHVHIPTYWRD